jgi:hypothetical protein
VVWLPNHITEEPNGSMSTCGNKVSSKGTDKTGAYCLGSHILLNAQANDFQNMNTFFILILITMKVCVLCLVVVLLPQGTHLFAVKINNNNNNNNNQPGDMLLGMFPFLI